MEAGGSQRASPLARELTRVFVNYNKHAVLLRRNLKETEGFFREMRHNYSNARASASTTAALEAGAFYSALQSRLNRAASGSGRLRLMFWSAISSEAIQLLCEVVGLQTDPQTLRLVPY
ncbi:hypothetical protein SRHO_G00267350 [Serrasalmus rhombeus]